MQALQEYGAIHSRQTLPNLQAVKEASIAFNSLGDWWLYEELDVVRGSPEFRGLLMRTEIRIRFSGFGLSTEPSGRT
jgi:hypothetical protein